MANVARLARISNLSEKDITDICREVNFMLILIFSSYCLIRKSERCKLEHGFFSELEK